MNMPAITSEMDKRKRELFKMAMRFPVKTQEVRAQIDVYAEDTAEIPYLFFFRGCNSFTRDNGRVWCPSVSELLTRCAELICDERLRSQGGDPGKTVPGFTPPPVKIDQEIAWAQEHAPNGVAKVVKGITAKSDDRPTKDQARELAIEAIERAELLTADEMSEKTRETVKFDLKMADLACKQSGYEPGPELEIRFTEAMMKVCKRKTNG